MHRVTEFASVLAVLGALGASGCDVFRNDTEVVAPRQDAPQTPPETRQPTRTEAPPPKETPAARPAVPEGTAHVAAALPSGQAGGSVLQLEKSAPQEVRIGEIFDYEIKMTNLTTAMLKEVVLTATLPTDFQPTATGPAAAVEGRGVTWSVGDMGPRETKAFLIRGKALKVRSLVCCTEVSYRNPKVCLLVRAVEPALKIVKTAPEAVILCDEIVSRIVVSNTGTGAATNVRVADDLPAGMSTTEGKRRLAFDVGTLTAGQSRSITLRTRAARTGTYTNQATATADGGLSAASNQVTTIVRQPVLVVSKSGPQTRFVGTSAAYTITVKNNGDAPARDTVLTDTLPTGVELVSHTPRGTATAGTVRWALGTLAPKASRQVALVVVPQQRGTLVNRATAKAYCAEASDRAVTEIKGIPAILLECVDLEDPIAVGANTTYAITVTNQGSAEGTGIVITCTLPAQQAFVSADGPTEDSVRGKVVTFGPLRSLAPKAKASYRVVVRGTATGDVRFQVSLTSDQMTSPAGETESTHIYE